MKTRTGTGVLLAACAVFSWSGALASTTNCLNPAHYLKTGCSHPLSLAEPAEDRVYLRFQTGWASKYECEGLDLWDGSLCTFVPEIQYREWVGKIWY